MSFMSTAPRPQTQPSGDLPGERIHLPVGRIGRDHVQVTMDQQRGPGGVLPLDAGDHAGPALVGLEDGRLEADLVEQPGDVFGGLAFPGAGVIAPVSGIDPDQVAAQSGYLVLGGSSGGAASGCVLRHRPIVALGRAGPARSPGMGPHGAGRPGARGQAARGPGRGRRAARRRGRRLARRRGRRTARRPLGGRSAGPGWKAAGGPGADGQAMVSRWRGRSLTSPERAGFAIVRRPAQAIPAAWLTSGWRNRQTR